MLSGSFATDFRQGTGPLDLDVALEDLSQKKGVRFVNFHRIGTHGGKLSIRTPEMYRMLTAMAPRDLQDRERVDDIIYDELERQLTSL